MIRSLATSLAALALCAPLAAQASDPKADLRARAPNEEIVYFVLPDRFENGDPKNDTGGIKGDRLQHGFDPTHKGFYHGGDLKGLTARLDYIQGLGATAIWFAPIFKNKPVQGPKGDESAGYHGYWVTDFTQVDPHFGTNDDFKAFVDAAHARGMKVYMDIIANHTADVIRYRDGDANGYRYRDNANYPYSRRGGVTGAPINPGFNGDSDPHPDNWAKLTDPTWAYTPYVPKGEETVKVPAWLNDPIYYHNRGDTHWVGESAVYGDFVGLDDLATQHPRVISGMIEIYASWIERFGIDGFRIDTAKHVNPEFWRAFVPAMLKVAKDKGIPNFHIFGEVATQDVDPALLARWTRIADLPSNLDMAFAAAAQRVVSGKAGTDVLARLFEDDALYQGGEAGALNLPTFLGNHDFGRFSMFVKQANPGISQDELLARTMLGHAMLMTLRGVPVIYYGDEQGFVSDGNDQLARENMFPSKVAVYNDNDLIGTDATTAQANFDRGHPLYRQIATLAEVRKATPALYAGATISRAFSDKPGLYAVSRIDPETGQEVVVAFNTSNQPVTQRIAIEPRSLTFSPLAGQCALAADAPGSLTITLPPLGYAVCAAKEWNVRSK
ncbi:alpha-amylase family glycosyl hydrolase [Novosphingobium sp.]|uniref:alpha-amylase family glycosyl hydrolase n=1 Tax=Novosphingobium sp. TaxID=1874826 RepID=UPI0022C4BEA6|nr:alpha-amylase family glycosyl hydrolase [Novosphingobium sp.]MCZ8017951.1 alpha-amylase family glycosyl hydrolase [Novosphingobium sp.]MCZ8034270.1 alpha-amylase family glycosyl hydrolase [Novosphingobium sp.]MCZ8052238.1 alpha-amylase family glycosyl hydrolase [Novosphingobium sp.]MCZ8061334.1 alpha-amylase family glycosyl hydrolase [Novosphingobium sp.]MCZ8232734.1 alpha-amylase family glycosyl hydrolase [Novosphingobium sp.]